MKIDYIEWGIDTKLIRNIKYLIRTDFNDVTELSY